MTERRGNAARCWSLAPANAAGVGIARLPQRRCCGSGCAAWLSVAAAGASAAAMRGSTSRCVSRTRCARAAAPAARDPARDGHRPAESLRALVRAGDATCAGWSTIEGLQHLQAAHARVAAACCCSPGIRRTWSWAGACCRKRWAQRVSIVVRRNNHPASSVFIDGARRRAFAATIAKKDVRGLLRALARGDDRGAAGRPGLQLPACLRAVLRRAGGDR